MLLKISALKSIKTMMDDFSKPSFIPVFNGIYLQDDLKNVIFP